MAFSKILCDISDEFSQHFFVFQVAFLMNYFWLCQMAWMVCEALVMYRALVSAVMNSHIPKYMLKFNLACWGEFSNHLPC